MLLGSIADGPFDSPNTVETCSGIYLVDQDDLFALSLHSMASEGHDEQKLLVWAQFDAFGEVESTFHDLLPGGVTEEVNILWSHISHAICGKAMSNFVNVLLAGDQVLDTMFDFDASVLV